MFIYVNMTRTSTCINGFQHVRSPDFHLCYLKFRYLFIFEERDAQPFERSYPNIETV